MAPAPSAADEDDGNRLRGAGASSRTQTPWAFERSSVVRASAAQKRSKAARERRPSSPAGGARDLEFECVLSRRVKARRVEYLVKWKRPRKDEEAATWVPVHHLHDPVAVAQHELGAESAAAYEDWAWVLDPSGAGWSVTPMPLVSSAAGERAAAASRLPDGWPSGVQYTPFLLWESGPIAMLRLRSVAVRPLPCVRILRLEPGHPVARAEGRTRRDGDGEARGLFARCAIPAGALIGDFAGQVKAQRVGDASRYLLEVFCDPSSGMRLDVDAQHYGNETRFINDYSGVAQEPNVSFCVYRQPRTGEIAIAVVSLTAISCGAELLAAYGEKYEMHDLCDDESEAGHPVHR